MEPRRVVKMAVLMADMMDVTMGKIQVDYLVDWKDVSLVDVKGSLWA